VIGTRIGPCEIVAPIGEGEMGEVHRARDTRLGRDVAIKVPRSAFTADAERLARFEREAPLAGLARPLEHHGDLRARGIRRPPPPGPKTGRGQDPLVPQFAIERLHVAVLPRTGR